MMGNQAISRRRAVAASVAVAIAGVLGVQALAAGAGATFTVNTTADALDAVPGNGICATSGAACSLRAAIQEANARPGADTIVVPAGTYSLGIPPRNQNDITTGDLDVTESVAITGAGAGATIVDGGAPPAGAPPEVRGIDRVFEVLADGGAVSFAGLTVSDGYAAEYGGAIANNSTAVIDVAGSTLSGNVAGKSGGAIDNHLGGAVHVRSSSVSGNFARETGGAISNNRDGVLTVVDSTVSSNGAAVVGLDEALVGAGAIANNAELDAVGSIVVNDSELSGNRAGGGRSGAAIYNDGGGSVTVDRTTFTKNIAAADGGAIANVAGEMTVTDSDFSENAATNGGAILAGDNAGTATVSRSSFTSNSATGNGGAISSGGLGALTVAEGTFTNNSADDWGGAVHNSDKGVVTILDTAFQENAGLNGGGFGNEGSGLVTVEDTTFTKNVALATALLTEGEGGGMHSNSGGEVVIARSAFAENDALSGGGFSNEGGGQVTIAETRFVSNAADEQGGGVLIQSGAVRLVDVDVISNVAGSPLEGGGGIAYAGDKAIGVGETAAIEDSRIRDNKSPGPGGGIDSRGDGPLSITTSSITGNSAAMGGAIHHVGDAPLELTRSTLSGNFAENGGGVFSDGDGEALVENSTVSGNRAGRFGGGVLVSSRVTVRSSTVAANAAPSGGGIDNGGGDLVGDGSVFLANTIVAGSPTGGNCAGTITSRGANMDSGDTCQFRELNDQPGTDPRLGSLASNGGPTQTHALLDGSPAQERAACTEVDPCPPVDQRGVERPLFVGVDAGAYESALPPAGGGGQQCSGRTERPVPVAFDSWISQSSPANNFGNDATLKVESKAAANQRALLRFALPVVPPGCRLVGARLRLYASSSIEDRTLEALRVASAWTELGVTWGNQPAGTGTAATAVSRLGPLEWDVLGQTLEMYERGNHGFLVRDGSESGLGAQAFHSREKGDDRPPELVLVFDDPDNPPPPGSCPTTPSLVTADRDSWVSQSSPSNTFGLDSTLKVKAQAGANARALVRFPLPVLPPGCTGVASAVMRLEAASAKEGRVLEARRIAGAWIENGVTWANQPATAGAAATTPSIDGPLEWDVTDLVPAMYLSGNHGFQIRDRDEDGVGDEQTLNSRDKIGDGPPELLLVFDDSTPDTTIDSGPPALGDSTEAAFTFSSSHDDARFECSLDGVAFGPCSSPHVVRGLTEGAHRLEVRATRGVGAVDPTPARYDWTVASPPDTTVDGPPSPSAGASARLTFASDDPDATFECSLNDALYSACASPVEYENLGDGPQEFRVRAVDPLGSIDPTPAMHAWTVAVPPETTIVSGPADPSNSTSASVAFGADEPGTFECRLGDGAWQGCVSPVAYTALADGRHTVEVRATDRAGNRDESPASHSWTVDTVAPETTIESGPADPTNSTSASLSFSAGEDAGFDCRLDHGEWAACTSPEAYGHLAEGRHALEVRATDRAGNVDESPASHQWTVDTVAPETTVTSGPADPTRETSATFAFGAGEDATFECRLDEGAWEDCASPRAYTDVSDGDHTLAVRATDPAGTMGAAVHYRWTVDTIAPVVRIESGPADPTNDSSAGFVLGASEASTFECRLDSGDWSRCSSDTNLADGRHVFEARATDRAGNVGPAVSYTWTVDTVSPETTISSDPAALNNVSSASFEFGASEGVRFECRLDAGDWSACGSPQAYVDLADGEHTFRVRATDAAGNVGVAASYSWWIDTVAPIVRIESAPASPTSDRAARFEFAAFEPASFECRLDGSAWTACESPQAYQDLAEGAHTFDVRATDVAGNRGPVASYTWTIELPRDVTAPDTSITERPSDPSSSDSARFAFTATEAATFECRLDDGVWTACASPQGHADLADGEHTFRVRATDAAGNVGPAASYTWTVDTAAPHTAIVGRPSELTNSTRATFAFSAGEAGARFECSIDGGAYVICTSPREYAGLAAGQHQFSVRATDAAGNTDASPATHTWTIDTTAPPTTIGTAPPATTTSTSASFTFTAEDPSDRFECSIDGAAFATCSSPREYTGLGASQHRFSVRATDAAGNTDVTPATHTWTISPPPPPPPEGCGAPVTAPATADAWIDENSPTANKGSDAILKVQSKGPRDNFRALLRFSLPPLPPGCTVASATLRLYAASARAGRTLQALRVATPWSENQVTWTNRPQPAGDAAVTTSGTGWREWGVSSQVQAMYAGGNHGFLVRDAFEGHDAEQQFHGREKGANVPQLVLRFAEGTSSLASFDAGPSAHVSTFSARATRTGRMRVPPATFVAYRFACEGTCAGTMTGRLTAVQGRAATVKLKPARFRGGPGARVEARVSLPAKAMRLVRKRRRAKLELMTVLRSGGSSARLPATIRLDSQH